MQNAQLKKETTTKAVLPKDIKEAADQLYTELASSGYDRNQIVTFTSELLGLVTTNLQSNPRGLTESK